MSRPETRAEAGGPLALPPAVLPPPALEVEDLRVMRRADDRCLLAEVSCVLDQDRFLVVSGRSGAGKSLLFRAVLGLLPAATWRVEGRVRLLGSEILGADGYDQAALSSLLGRQVMAVFQEPGAHLHPSLSVGWQLQEMWRPGAWRLGAESRRQAGEALERVALEGAQFPGRFPFQLSQGQQQRAMIAMALSGAVLVLADEPTSALDPATEGEIVRLLAELRQSGRLRSLLLIAHDLEPYSGLLEPDDWLLRIELEGGAGRARPARRLAETVPPAPPAGEAPRPVMEARPVLQVEELTVGPPGRAWRRPVSIFREVSFTVGEGELFAVTGTSGSGKTTLAKAIIGLLPIQRGRVLFRPTADEAVELSSRRRDLGAHRRRLQLVFQDALSTFDPRMTVGETLAEILRYAGLGDAAAQEERIRPLLERLGLATSSSALAEILGRYPREFSGGQRQRLGVARALVLQPRLVIADEPFAAQDIDTALEMVGLFRRLVEDLGVSFILISHHRRLTRLLCRRGIDLDRLAAAAAARPAGSRDAARPGPDADPDPVTDADDSAGER